MSVWAGLGIWAFSHALDDNEDKEVQSVMRICAVAIGVGGIFIWAFGTPCEPIADSGDVVALSMSSPFVSARRAPSGYFRGFAPH